LEELSSASIPHTSAAVAIYISFKLIPSPTTHRAKHIISARDSEPAVILLHCCRHVLI